MKPTDTVRMVVLAEMLTLYRAPSQVQNPEQAAVFQEAIITGLAGFKPTESEMREVWEKFKQTWTRTTWPTPGDLCQAMVTHRKGHWEPRLYQPPPIEDRTMTAKDEADFQDCMRKLRNGGYGRLSDRQRKSFIAMGERFESQRA